MGESVASREATETEAKREAAFQSLAERRLDSSYGLANSILGSPLEAQDAVHDAFVTAWQKWASLKDPTKFDAWFQRIVVNTCRDRLRQATRRAAKDISEQTALATPDASGAVTDRVRVEQALVHLKPDDQVLIALRYNHDLKLADIARLLGIPTGTVKWRLRTAHKRLRAAMERSEGSLR